MLDCCAPLEIVQKQVRPPPSPKLSIISYLLLSLQGHHLDGVCVLGSMQWRHGRDLLRFEEVSIIKQRYSSDSYSKQTNESTLEHFRECIKRGTTSDNLHMVVSYDRRGVSQTGTGHFSPIGGYNEQRDMVLVLDVGSFISYYINFDCYLNSITCYNYQQDSNIHHTGYQPKHSSKPHCLLMKRQECQGLKTLTKQIVRSSNKHIGVIC